MHLPLRLHGDAWHSVRRLSSSVRGPFQIQRYRESPFAGRGEDCCVKRQSLRRDHHRNRRWRRDARLSSGAVRQTNPHSGARRLRSPRESQLGPQGRQCRRPLQHQRILARQGRQRSSSRTPTTTWAAIPSFTARRCSACAREDFGELRHHGGISPAWPISYDDLEPYYTQAENLYQVHGNRGEDPTEPPAELALSLARREP